MLLQQWSPCAAMLWHWQTPDASAVKMVLLSCWHSKDMKDSNDKAPAIALGSGHYLVAQLYRSHCSM